LFLREKFHTTLLIGKFFGLYFYTWSGSW